MARQRWVNVKVALVGGVIGDHCKIQCGLTGCWEDWISCFKLVNQK